LWQVGGFSTGPPVSSTNKTDCHEITEIVLKVALNTTKPTPVFHGVKTYYRRDYNVNLFHRVKNLL
jgi:hypothetical protein